MTQKVILSNDWARAYFNAMPKELQKRFAGLFRKHPDILHHFNNSAANWGPLYTSLAAGGHEDLRDEFVRWQMNRFCR